MHQSIHPTSYLYIYLSKLVGQSREYMDMSCGHTYTIQMPASGTAEREGLAARRRAASSRACSTPCLRARAADVIRECVNEVQSNSMRMELLGVL